MLGVVSSIIIRALRSNNSVQRISEVQLRRGRYMKISTKKGIFYCVPGFVFFTSLKCSKRPGNITNQKIMIFCPAGAFPKNRAIGWKYISTCTPMIDRYPTRSRMLVEGEVRPLPHLPGFRGFGGA